MKGEPFDLLVSNRWAWYVFMSDMFQHDISKHKVCILALKLYFPQYSVAIKKNFLIQLWYKG